MSGVKKFLNTASRLQFASQPGDHGLASVTAIVGPNGGVRIIISKRGFLRFHLQEGEIAYTVPDYWVWEPVPYELIPTVVKVAERYLIRATNRSYELMPAQL